MIDPMSFVSQVENGMRNRVPAYNGSQPLNYHERAMIESIAEALRMQPFATAGTTFVSPHHEELNEMRRVFQDILKLYGTDQMKRAITDTELGISTQIRDMKKSLFESFEVKLKDHEKGSKAEFDKLFDVFEKRMQAEISGTVEAITKKGRGLIEEMKQHSEAFMKELVQL